MEGVIITTLGSPDWPPILVACWFREIFGKMKAMDRLVKYDNLGPGMCSFRKVVVL